MAKSIRTQANQYKKAIETYTNILETYSEKDLESHTNMVLLNLIDVYKKTNQYQKAYEAYEKLLTNFRKERIDNQFLYTEELNYNMKFNEKLAEIERLKSSNEKALISRAKNKTLIATLFVSVLLLLMVLFLVIRAKKHNKELAKRSMIFSNPAWKKRKTCEKLTK